MFNRRTLLRRFCGSLSLALAQAKPRFSSTTETNAPTQSWEVHGHLRTAPGETPEERMTQLVKFADRLGIDRVMLSLGFPLQPDPSPRQLREENDQVLQAVRRWPSRAFGFVYLNPNHLDFSLREFDRCVRDGPMVGVKLWVARRCNAPELDPIIERAASLEAPILQHTWLKVGGNEPRMLKHGRLDAGGTLDDRIPLARIAAPGNPPRYADHRANTHATVKLPQPLAQIAGQQRQTTRHAA